MVQLCWGFYRWDHGESGPPPTSSNSFTGPAERETEDIRIRAFYSRSVEFEIEDLYCDEQLEEEEIDYDSFMYEAENGIGGYSD